MDWRSLLFTPGDAPERLASAPTRGADAIILDLEDAVAPEAKAQARAKAGHCIAALDAAGAAAGDLVQGAHPQASRGKVGVHASDPEWDRALGSPVRALNGRYPRPQRLQ